MKIRKDVAQFRVVHFRNTYYPTTMNLYKTIRFTAKEISEIVETGREKRSFSGEVRWRCEQLAKKAQRLKARAP